MSDRAAERIADALKPEGDRSRLVKVISRDWLFFSDVSIYFLLIDGEERLLCKFESDAYYVKGERFGGEHRRFIALEGSDSIYSYIKDLTNEVYTKEELIDLVYLLAEDFKIAFPLEDYEEEGEPVPYMQ
jgi:hypothetical protein